MSELNRSGNLHSRGVSRHTQLDEQSLVVAGKFCYLDNTIRVTGGVSGVFYQEHYKKQA